MNHMTPQKLKTWAHMHATDAVLIVAQEALCNTIRAKQEEYKPALLDKYRHRFDYDTANSLWRKLSPRRRQYLNLTAETLTEENMFLLHGDHVGETNKRVLAEYYDELDGLHRSHGFTKIKKGFCPLLVAESELRRMKRALSSKLKELIGLDPEGYTDLESEKKLDEMAFDVTSKAATELQLWDAAEQAAKSVNAI